MCLLSHGDAGAHILDSSKHLREKAAGGAFSKPWGPLPSSVNNTRLAALPSLVLEDSGVKICSVYQTIGEDNRPIMPLG